MRYVSLTIRNAVIVTAAVILGFCVGDALDLPVWLQGAFLLPAVFIFCRLYSMPCPSLGKIIGFDVFFSGFIFLFQFGFKHIPERHFWIYYFIFVLIVQFGPILHWSERQFLRYTGRSEQDAPSDGDNHPD
jgi:hypothetical protein